MTNLRLVHGEVEEQDRLVRYYDPDPGPVAVEVIVDRDEYEENGCPASLNVSVLPGV